MNNKRRAIKLISSAVSFTLCFLTSISNAHNNVVVIPLLSDDLRPLKNIITVAKENGDFTDPVAAMESIKDSSKSNPYLMVIAPGHYLLESPLRIKYYVEVTGSGQNSTKLIASSNFSVTNEPYYLGSRFMVSSDYFFTLRNLSLESVNNTQVRGVVDATLSFMELSNIGIHHEGGGPGIYGKNCRAILSNVNITIKGSGTQYGIDVDNCNLILRDVNIGVSGGLKNYGYHQVDSTANISNSAISASTNSLIVFGITPQDQDTRSEADIDRTLVSNSTLTGPVSGGNFLCSFVFDGGGPPSGPPLDSNCE